MAKKKVNGVITLDLRDSRPDWSALALPKAPRDAPNVLIVLEEAVAAFARD